MVAMEKGQGILRTPNAVPLARAIAPFDILSCGANRGANKKST